MNYRKISESITVPGKLESLEAIAKFVLRVAQMSRLDTKASYKLRLAIDEIATNIIQHGYTEAGLTGDIICTARSEGNCLTITLEDWGLAHNSAEYPPTNNLQQSLLERPIGGLGIYLAIESVDNLQYERIGDRNRHIFIVNC